MRYQTDLIVNEFNNNSSHNTSNNNEKIEMRWETIVENFTELFKADMNDGKKIHIDNLGDHPDPKLRVVDGARDRYIKVLLFDSILSFLSFHEYPHNHRRERRTFFQMKELLASILIEYFNALPSNEKCTNSSTSLQILESIDSSFCNKSLVDSLYNYIYKNFNQNIDYNDSNYDDILIVYDEWVNIGNLNKYLLRSNNSHRKNIEKYESIVNALTERYEQKSIEKRLGYEIKKMVQTILIVLDPVLVELRKVNICDVMFCLMQHNCKDVTLNYAMTVSQNFCNPQSIPSNTIFSNESTYVNIPIHQASATIQSVNNEIDLKSFGIDFNEQNE